MSRRVQGVPNGEGIHLGIAVASWNGSITDRLLAGAMRRSDELGVSEVTIVRVPGALELPVASRHLVDQGCHCIVAIGTVIKGDTDHYDIVVRESSSGIAFVAVETGIPVTNAILAVHDASQAGERSGDGPSNKGWEAVEAAVLTATALRALGGQ